MKIKELLVVLLTISLLVISNTIFASNEYLLEESNQIQPRFTAMIKCWNSLVLGDLGKMQCYGKTEVRNGYIAGVVIELQRDDGKDWTTIKTWSGTDEDYINLEKEWYVTSGYDYRLQVTHSAYDLAGSFVESSVSYSKTVSY